MAHFALEAGRVSRAIQHRTVSEIWFVLAGRGEMWRQASAGAEEFVVALGAGRVPHDTDGDPVPVPRPGR